MDKLKDDDKMRLLRFVCSFAWADLTISGSERAFVEDLVARLGLSDELHRVVDGWLDTPPLEDDLDPYDIPASQRQLFFEAALGMVQVDGDAGAKEIENLALLNALMDESGAEASLR